MQRVADDRPASDGLVAVVGLLIGVLLATIWMTATDGRTAASAPLGAVGPVSSRPDPLHHLAASATVRVVAHGCRGEFRGTGVVLRGGLVMTAAHVSAGARRITVVDSDGGARRVGPVLSAVATDVATAPLRAGASVVRRQDDPAVGTALVVAGASGGQVRVRDARVAAYVRGTGAGDPPVAMRLDVRVAAGDSGGAVLDRKGRLVGLVYAAEHGSGRALVIPASVLNAALAGSVAVGTC